MPNRPTPPPTRRGGAPDDPRAELAKQARLWGLAVICAAAGAGTVAATDRLLPGVLVFLVALVILGPVLYWFEKRHRR